MKRNRLLLLLALLITAATGAWAQSTVNVYYNALNKQELFDGMTKIDANNDGGNEMNGLWLLQDYLATYNHHHDNAADDWLVTPAIELQAGVTYTIAIDAIKPAPEQSTYTETFEVKVGTAATAANLSAGVTAIATTEVTTAWTNYHGTFTPTTSGIYYVGIHATSPADQNWFRIRNLVVGVKYYSVNLNDGELNPTTWKAKVGDATEFGKLPLENVAEGQTVTLKYNGQRRVRKVTATTDAEPAANIVDLSTLTADYVALDGDVLTGETTSYKVTIAAGATVTLDGVNISSSSYCIKCAGEATIILKDGTTNTLTSTSDEYPALSIGDANTTLTIQGNTGVLNVTSGEYCAGIGGGYKNTNSTCGNITIEGGVITAQGGIYGSGIGTDCGTATCGDIIIKGGTITAKGGINAAGIGTGNGFANPAVCGDITIANTVTKVTATKGEGAPHSIGKGYGGIATCGTVTIGCTLDTNGNPEGGTKFWENNAAVSTVTDNYLKQATIIYPEP